VTAELIEEPGGDFLAQLPRGRHGLPRDYVRLNQRERLAAATIAIVAGRGYDEATIAGIVAAAHLSRRTFYDHFSGKPQCFLAAYGLITEHLAHATRSATDPEDAWPRQVRARLDAALASLAANPDLARFLLAVPTGTAQTDVGAAHRGFLACAAAELAAGGPGAYRSPAFERAFLAGLASRILAAVDRGEGERLRDLGAELSEAYLLTFEPCVSAP
jgi:AcrR family transcriptional regulator